MAALIIGLNLRPAGAETVAIVAGADATLFQNNPGNSAGGQTQFYVGTNSNSSPRRGLVQFDIAGNVPSGSTITGVELTLTLSQVAGGGGPGGSGTPTIGLHEVAAAWGEGSASMGSGQGTEASPGDATWNSRQHGSALWTTPGGDFNPTASASLTIVGIVTNVSYTWLSTAALVADVQGWLDTPDDNFGWLLLNTDETSAQTFRAFYSSEYTDNLAFRPTLAVSYVIPEPSTGMLAVLAAAVMAVQLGIVKPWHARNAVLR